eukprot:TRINITY_DN5697_c0_g1_i6.p1 TRINITY_DN5697_c0_g1~~TRINITY_DN5697_c0_g1_i6.p1  ORF type:complete len:1059 (+),score=81.05 TRINITY_DN5697_c0_g1_i6:105-3179(+)
MQVLHEICSSAKSNNWEHCHLLFKSLLFLVHTHAEYVEISHILQFFATARPLLTPNSDRFFSPIQLRCIRLYCDVTIELLEQHECGMALFKQASVSRHFVMVLNSLIQCLKSLQTWQPNLNCVHEEFGGRSKDRGSDGGGGSAGNSFEQEGQNMDQVSGQLQAQQNYNQTRDINSHGESRKGQNSVDKGSLGEKWTNMHQGLCGVTAGEDFRQKRVSFSGSQIREKQVGQISVAQGDLDRLHKAVTSNEQGMWVSKVSKRKGQGLEHGVGQGETDRGQSFSVRLSTNSHEDTHTEIVTNDSSITSVTSEEDGEKLEDCLQEEKVSNKVAPKFVGEDKLYDFIGKNQIVNPDNQEADDVENQNNNQQQGKAIPIPDTQISNNSTSCSQQNVGQYGIEKERLSQSCDDNQSLSCLRNNFHLNQDNQNPRFSSRKLSVPLQHHFSSQTRDFSATYLCHKNSVQVPPYNSHFSHLSHRVMEQLHGDIQQTLLFVIKTLNICLHASINDDDEDDEDEERTQVKNREATPNLPNLLWLLQSTKNIYLRENICKLLGHQVNKDLGFIESEQQVYEFCSVLVKCIVNHTQSILTPEIFTVILMFALLTRSKNSTALKIANTLYYGGYFNSFITISKMTRNFIRRFSVPENVELRAYGIFSMSHAVCCEVITLLIENKIAPDYLIDEVIDNTLDALITLQIGNFKDINIKYLAIRRILECVVLILQRPKCVKVCVQKGICQLLLSLYFMEDEEVDFNGSEAQTKLHVKQKQLMQQMIARLFKVLMVDSEVVAQHTLFKPQCYQQSIVLQESENYSVTSCTCFACQQQRFELNELKRRVITQQNENQLVTFIEKLRFEELCQDQGSQGFWSVQYLQQILKNAIQQKQPLVLAQLIEIAYRWCERCENEKNESSSLINLLTYFDKKCQDSLLEFWQYVLEGEILDESINALIKGRILSYFLIRVKNILVNDGVVQSLQLALQDIENEGNNNVNGINNDNNINQGLNGQLQINGHDQGLQISIARKYIHAIQEHLH